MSKERKIGSPIIRSPGCHGLPAYLEHTPTPTPPPSPTRHIQPNNKAQAAIDAELKKEFKRFLRK